LTYVDPNTPDVLFTRLGEAEQALHTLITSGGLVELMHNGKIMRWSRQNLAALRMYIAELRGQLNLPGARPRARRVEF
jgi:hypothetical protein